MFVLFLCWIVCGGCLCSLMNVWCICLGLVNFIVSVICLIGLLLFCRCSFVVLMCKCLMVCVGVLLVFWWNVWLNCCMFRLVVLVSCLIGNVLVRCLWVKFSVMWMWFDFGFICDIVENCDCLLGCWYGMISSCEILCVIFVFMFCLIMLSVRLMLEVIFVDV